jgi:hypothetical protein
VKALILRLILFASVADESQSGRRLARNVFPHCGAGGTMIHFMNGERELG